MNNQILQETIEDLKNNPDACTISEITDSGIFAIGESILGEKLKNFISDFAQNNLLDLNYLENYEKIEKKEVDSLSYEEVLTKLTFIIRGDRFCSGLIYEKFKDGTLLQLIEKLNEFIK